MRIAVASEGLDVAPLFRSTVSFMCYTVKRGIITECQNMPNPKLPIDELVELFKELEIDVMIVGRIEYEFANRLCRAGIEVVAGACGNAAAVETLSEMLDQIQRRGMPGLVGYIDLTDPSAPVMDYSGRFTVLFGQDESINYQFGKLESTLAQLKSADRGTLDLSVAGEVVTFTPF